MQQQQRRLSQKPDKPLKMKLLKVNDKATQEGLWGDLCCLSFCLPSCIGSSAAGCVHLVLSFFVLGFFDWLFVFFLTPFWLLFSSASSVLPDCLCSSLWHVCRSFTVSVFPLLVCLYLFFFFSYSCCGCEHLRHFVRGVLLTSRSLIRSMESCACALFCLASFYLCTCIYIYLLFLLLYSGFVYIMLHAVATELRTLHRLQLEALRLLSARRFELLLQQLLAGKAGPQQQQQQHPNLYELTKWVLVNKNI